jgi:hypothetical protein
MISRGTWPSIGVLRVYAPPLVESGTKRPSRARLRMMWRSARQRCGDRQSRSLFRAQIHSVPRSGGTAASTMRRSPTNRSESADQKWALNSTLVPELRSRPANGRHSGGLDSMSQLGRHRRAAGPTVPDRQTIPALVFSIPYRCLAGGRGRLARGGTDRPVARHTTAFLGSESPWTRRSALAPSACRTDKLHRS